MKFMLLWIIKKLLIYSFYEMYLFFPDNKFRTYLMTYPSESTDYINAVTIPVSRSPCSFKYFH